MLLLGTISMENQVAEPEKMKSDLEALKRVGVDGVMVDCWWGIVEKTLPQTYDWSGYRQLFSLVRDCKLKLQCWDKYLLRSLKNAAEMTDQPTWADGSSDAGGYNSKPQDSTFFRDGYKSPYGEFFLNWYSQTLIEHGDSVLTKARQALGDTKLAVKVSGVHWWYKTGSHAAELAAGYYNLDSRCGYTPIARMLATHNDTFNVTCIELRTEEQTASCPEALADPEALVSQVLQAAREQGVKVACENAQSCIDNRSGYGQILAQARPQGHANQTLAGFAYLRLGPKLM